MLKQPKRIPDYEKNKDCFDVLKPLQAVAIQRAKARTEQDVYKRQAKDIHDKYIEVPYTTAFGILFLPFEGLYAEVVN